MDYSHATYFAGAQPPPYQQFIGIPPLTPSHSNSAGSDDYNHTSPPDAFEYFPNDQFPTFESYAAHFNAHPVFPGPPTPPNQQPAVHPAAQLPPLALNGAPPVEPPPPDATAAATKTEPPTDEQAQAQAQAPRQGSNSEEDDMTPTLSKRKAQNRAAQRAFRERKERHVKDLEAKLASLVAAQQQTASENERLKREMQKISTENEILRATSSLQTVGGGSPPAGGGAPPEVTTGPLEYQPVDFYTSVLTHHPDKRPSHRVVTSERGQRLYAAGAAWDFIVGHELYRRGGVDLAGVSERLRDRAKCDGQGPVFEESVIVDAMRENAAHGSDELL